MRVLVFGTFDQFHPGHQFVLTEALRHGTLTVIIARDATVERIKGRLPVQDEISRKAAVQNFVPAAQVLLGDTTDYLKPVHTAQPDLILLGYDQELPLGISLDDLPCPMERLPAFLPELHKSSLRRPA